jgi:predicted Ser/Thr protein kinase
LKALLRAKDSLAGTLKIDASIADIAQTPIVADLMTKLRGLRRAAGVRPPASATPLSISDVHTVPPSDENTSPPPSKLPEAVEVLGPLDADTQAGLTDFLSPPQAADELGRLGKYRVLKILGYGGMGVVFKGEDTDLKRPVAIKAMLPTLAASASAGKRFKREAQAMAAVEHDHIVRIYQVDEDRGVPFMAMEFLKGEPLDERLKRHEKVPLSEVLRIGREIAEGLGAAHGQGLIHRDIKPGNVWLEAPRTRVKILDFGLARAAAQDSGLTQQGAIIGTPAFMAPEQARGAAVDARCDLFSLGVVLYRLCTGRQPFTGTDTVSTLMAVATVDPPAPMALNADVPPELSALVMKLLEKDPARRTASAAEVVRALQSLEQQLARKTEAEAPTVQLADVQPARSPLLRWLPRLAAAAALLAVVVGGTVGAVIYLKSRGNGTTPPGAFVIETTDPDFVFNVNEDDSVTLKDKKHGTEYRLKVVQKDNATGEYELDVTDVKGDLSFKTDRLNIKRGDMVVASLWFERKVPATEGTPVKVAPATDLPDKVTDAWIAKVAGLPPEEQAAQVTGMLQKLNKNDVQATARFVGKSVTSLTLNGDAVADLSPLCTLKDLRTLDCSGAARGRHQLSDLSPLKGMQLTSLTCSYTNVSSLSALEGMPLTFLKIDHTQVKDLKPLANMPLTVLDCHNTDVSDLAPIEDMRFRSLNVSATRVSNFAPLKGMPLESLQCANTPFGDLTLLKDMPLRTLVCSKTQVSDLKPIKDLKLTQLDISGTKVSDLSPLAKMPLESLTCDYKPERDKQLLLSVGTLKSLNNVPKELLLAGELSRPADFDNWVETTAALSFRQQLDEVNKQMHALNPYVPDRSVNLGKKQPDGLIELSVHDRATNLWPLQAYKGVKSMTISFWAGGTATRRPLSDLRPLKGLNIIRLDCGYSQVADLTPLQGMPLATLNLEGTLVSDLSPLKDSPLTNINLANCQNLTDLSGLSGLKLRMVNIQNTPVSDLSPLKNSPLTHLQCVGTRVDSLAPLTGAPLIELQFAGTPVSDLTPLKNSKITRLDCSNTAVADLSVVKNMPQLTSLNCSNTPVADLSPIRNLKLTSLEFDHTRVSDLKPLERNEIPTTLSFSHTLVSDLKPLEGNRNLTSLNCSFTRVSGLKPLEKTLGLKSLNCAHTEVSDLSPLKVLKLTILSCNGTKVTDFGPLMSMPLERLECDVKLPGDDGGLRTRAKPPWAPTFTINQVPAADFLAELDAKPIKPLEEEWVKDAAVKKDAKDQLDFVTDELKKRNFFLIGKVVVPKIEGDVVTGLELPASGVSDLSPLRGLPGLKTLKCVGGFRSDNTTKDSRLLDLTSLKGLKLTSLDISNTNIADLSPLKGMPLTELIIHNTPVCDLSPLKGMPLKRLVCTKTAVCDLSPLKDCKLTSLDTAGTVVSDLSPLKGIPLTELYIGSTQVSDLAPLHGMPLTKLNMNALKVPDLSPLKEARLELLDCRGTRVTDLSPLADMPLKLLWCDFQIGRDAAILRPIKTLEKINDLAAKEALK